MVVRRIKTIIRKLDTSGPAARRPGSGRKRTVRAVDNIIDVNARNLRNFEKKTNRRKSRVLCDLVRTLFSNESQWYWGTVITHHASMGRIWSRHHWCVRQAMACASPRMCCCKWRTVWTEALNGISLELPMVHLLQLWWILVDFSLSYRKSYRGSRFSWTGCIRRQICRFASVSTSLPAFGPDLGSDRAVS